MDWTQIGLFALASVGGGIVAYSSFRVTLALQDKRISDLELKCRVLEAQVELVKENHTALDLKLVTEMGEIKTMLARIEAKLEGKGK